MKKPHRTQNWGPRGDPGPDWEEASIPRKEPENTHGLKMSCPRHHKDANDVCNGDGFRDALDVTSGITLGFLSASVATRGFHVG